MRSCRFSRCNRQLGRRNGRLTDSAAAHPSRDRRAISAISCVGSAVAVTACHEPLPRLQGANQVRRYAPTYRHPPKTAPVSCARGQAPEQRRCPQVGSFLRHILTAHCVFGAHRPLEAEADSGSSDDREVHGDKDFRLTVVQVRSWGTLAYAGSRCLPLVIAVAVAGPWQRHAILSVVLSPGCPF